MERALSLEDKIRKAEEIYYRRNNARIQEVLPSNNKLNFKKAFIKKITIQTLISACIFTSVLAVLNNNTYSQDSKNVINGLLTYNIDFQTLYKKMLVKLNVTTNDENLKTEEVTVIEEHQEAEEILGITDEEINEEASSIDNTTEDEQYMSKDISIIKPLEGVITSRFGLRENVEPFNHTGIDIAANTGTVIISAMDGVAEVVSEEGSYGKHIKITNGEISTLYAHCSKLYVKQGDYIKQGEQIAEVGSTGNATGPHLHFEIIRNGEYIDPDSVLDF